MVKSQKDFVALIDLPVGEHQYKFVVDENWVHDINQPAVKNELGNMNNVIKVGRCIVIAFFNLHSGLIWN